MTDAATTTGAKLLSWRIGEVTITRLPECLSTMLGTDFLPDGFRFRPIANAILPRLRSGSAGPSARNAGSLRTRVTNSASSYGQSAAGRRWSRC